MNAAISKLFVVVVVLFALLIGWTSRWTVFDASSLTTTCSTGARWSTTCESSAARSSPTTAPCWRNRSRPAATWKRTYPTGSLFAQPVGYLNAIEGQVAGLELSHESDLRGVQTGLSSIFGQLSPHPVGDDVYTSLDPKAQRLAQQLLAGRRGAAIALNPKTGDVYVMYSNPTYNDNHPSQSGAGQSTFNRVTQSGYPPGSTFKIVTTTAAMDTGKYTPTSIIDGKSPLTVSGVPLENDGNTNWGPITLTKALTNSVNTVFAQVGEAVGKQTMANYMKRFGFYSTPPLDYPPTEMVASGERQGTKLLSPTSGLIDLGRMSIGQDKLEVTPLQMAMVASAVADGGKLMTPHIVTKVVNQDGQTVKTIQPSVYHTVMKPETAHELSQMMTDGGRGGNRHPGPTRRDPRGGQDRHRAGRAHRLEPDRRLVHRLRAGRGPEGRGRGRARGVPDGFGGTVAAPVAAQLIKTLLAEGK